MASVITQNRRVVSGLRPTGRLHLGHYYGVLKEWVRLQHEYECFYFVADWHALSTQFEHSDSIRDNVWEMVIDWLAVGIDPGDTKLFLQSRVPEHAEMHLLLSMITPLAWLERVPSYRERRESSETELDTYGFLGYPLLQAADVLMYKAGLVPVGEDHIPHIELARDIARRFNFLFGREPDFEEKAEAAIAKIGRRNAKLYRRLRKDFQEHGDGEALAKAQALLETQQNISVGDVERLFGYLEGGGKIILPEPHELATDIGRMPGLDGLKMSKRAGNTIELREAPDSVAQKINTMPTDPARARLSDPGEPAKCPVYGLHEIFSDDTCRAWVMEGCRTAQFGCLKCKEPLIDSIVSEQQPILERAKEYEQDPEVVRSVIAEGTEAARDIARETLDEVHHAMNLVYR
ncbi:MAG: tryptophan--tRNA ligase [Pseudomonadota bacterium]